MFRLVTFTMGVIAVVLLLACTAAPAPDYQQSIGAPPEGLVRWDDTSLGIVCYGRNPTFGGLSCVQVRP